MYQKRLGKWMLSLAWIILLGLMGLLFQHYLSMQENPNQDLEYADDQPGDSVTLKRNRYGHYVATALINQLAVEVLLDTGASSVSVPEHIAERLNLKPGRAYLVNTANGTTQVYSTRLDSVQIGEVRQHHVRAHINPAMQTDQVLIGMTFLKNLDLVQSGDELTLSNR